MPVVIPVSILVFSLLHLAGGDPAALMLGAEATPEDIARLRVEMGLDRPLYEQYLIWLGRVARGDLGRSIHPTRFYVSDLILQRLPVTPQLGLQAIEEVVAEAFAGAQLIAPNHAATGDQAAAASLPPVIARIGPRVFSRGVAVGSDGDAADQGVMNHASPEQEPIPT